MPTRPTPVANTVGVALGPLTNGANSFRGEDGAPAAAQDQDEGSEELRAESAHHRLIHLLVPLLARSALEASQA